MTVRECICLIKNDLQRFGGGDILYLYITKETFQLTFWFRVASYFWFRKKTLLFPIYVIVRMIYRHMEHKTCIQLPVGTNIGGGLRFHHYSCIIIAQTSKIGRNVSIHQGVTIGRVFSGEKAGVPIIGNNVVIFAGAKILGKVYVGDNAVIGANAVVTKDIPANAVAVGVPAKIISNDSSKCFNETWSEVFARPYNDKK